MKKLILKLIILLLPFSVGFIYLESRLSAIPNTHNLKRMYLEQQLDRIEILSTGSSHGFAINPRYLSHPAYNIFNNSQDIYFDVRLVEKYLERMPRLKQLIVPISYFTLEYQLDRHAKEPWREAFYFRYWGVLPRRLISFLDSRFFFYSTIYGQQAVINYIKDGFVNRYPPPVEETGWWSLGDQTINTAAETDAAGKQGVKGFHDNMHPEAIPENMRLLSELVEKCQARGIEVVIITTPNYHTFYDNIDPIRYQRMQDNIQKLTSQYHLRYFNYMKDPRFGPADFFDRTHIGTQGAEKFTRLLDHDVVQSAPVFGQ